MQQLKTHDVKGVRLSLSSVDRCKWPGLQQSSPLPELASISHLHRHTLLAPPNVGTGRVAFMHRLRWRRPICRAAQRSRLGLQRLISNLEAIAFRGEPKTRTSSPCLHRKGFQRSSLRPEAHAIRFKREDLASGIP
jgi:hypothetical protein